MTVGASDPATSVASFAIVSTVSVEASVLNAGVIQAEGDAVYLLNSDGAANLTLRNMGSLFSGNEAAALHQHGAGGNFEAFNSGTLAGGNVGLQTISSGGTATAANSGTISGEFAYLSLSQTTVDEVLNTGTLIGDVQLGGGNDVFGGGQYSAAAGEVPCVVATWRA